MQSHDYFFLFSKEHTPAIETQVVLMSVIVAFLVHTHLFVYRNQIIATVYG